MTVSQSNLDSSTLVAHNGHQCHNFGPQGGIMSLLSWCHSGISFFQFNFRHPFKAFSPDGTDSAHSELRCSGGGHMRVVSILIFTIIFSLISFSASAKSRTACRSKMTHAMDVAYDIGYAEYMKSGDMGKAKAKGKRHLQSVCRTYCRGIKLKNSKKKISCREQIGSSGELKNLINRVNFEEQKAFESEQGMLDI